MTVGEMIRLLKKNGFKFENHGKKHDVYKNSKNGAEVQIPRRQSQELKKGTEEQILRDAGLK